MNAFVFVRVHLYFIDMLVNNYKFIVTVKTLMV